MQSGGRFAALQQIGPNKHREDSFKRAHAAEDGPVDRPDILCQRPALRQSQGERDWAHFFDPILVGWDLRGDRGREEPGLRDGRTPEFRNHRSSRPRERFPDHWSAQQGVSS